jgi:hypothetical protein
MNASPQLKICADRVIEPSPAPRPSSESLPTGAVIISLVERRARDLAREKNERDRLRRRLQRMIEQNEALRRRAKPR